MTEFYNYWLNIDSWSFDEAAFILNGKNPELYECVNNFDPSIGDFGNQNAEKWQQEIYKTYCILRRAEWKKYAGDSAPNITLNGKAHPRHIFNLATDKQLKIPDELLEKWKIIGRSTHGTNRIDQGFMYGDYTTKKLEILLEAKDRFWTNYDKDDPSTAPLNEQVEEWLVQQKDSSGKAISKRAAEVMASILRDESLPSGRRKS